ncbi:MAG: DUF4396 domain-containing protein [Gammaproteobacteria bacterium]|nr:DUF4396 domain-containing protein [Gammaproteobacteria bacterium]
MRSWQEERTGIKNFWRIDWGDRATWARSSVNTFWCLVGCSIGDMGTILFFQATGIPWPVLAIMALAVVNGIITSIVLETCILLRQMPFRAALKTAAGMSLISMISMEIAMNAVDVGITGGARLTLGVLPAMWAAGFVTPLPYNYWRLKALGEACH